MVRSGVTVQLMTPLVGLGSSPNVSTNSQVAELVYANLMGAYRKILPKTIIIMIPRLGER